MKTDLKKEDRNGVNNTNCFLTHINVSNTMKTNYYPSKNESTDFNDMIIDWKALTYKTLEADWNIQTIESIINMLKYLGEGYLQEIEVYNAISELEKLEDKLMQDNSIDIATSIELENKIQSIVEDL